MFDVFGDIKNILEVSPINIDNNIFRLHYKATMFILIACSLLVSQKQYFGDPIDCVVNDMDSGIMDTYCWIHSTYTVPTNTGVGPNHDPITKEKHDTKHHKYYQWVVLVLFLQALMFYIPRYLWMAMEDGKIQMLAADLNCPILDNDKKKERIEMIIRYFDDNLNSHTFYAFRYFTCEALNFINVIAQMFLTDRFLGGEFLEYGSNVVKISQEPLGTRQDPMDLVFPKVAKCTFELFGAGGSAEKKDGLCVLPLNILNEKIYIFIWFWFIFVAVMTGLGLLYRCATIAIPQVRFHVLKTRSNNVASNDISTVLEKCQIGDWFLLYKLARNMDSMIYKEFIEELAMKFQGGGSISR